MVTSIGFKLNSSSMFWKSSVERFKIYTWLIILHFVIFFFNNFHLIVFIFMLNTEGNSSYSIWVLKKIYTKLKKNKNLSYPWNDSNRSYVKYFEFVIKRINRHHRWNCHKLSRSYTRSSLESEPILYTCVHIT